MTLVMIAKPYPNHQPIPKQIPFLLIAPPAHVQSLCGFLGMFTAYVFLQINQMMTRSLERVFTAITFFGNLSFMQRFSVAIFSKNISQGNVVSH